MSTFRTLLILISSTYFLMSCVKYQYTTVNSNLAANDSREFFLENDSLMIKYSFSGQGGPVHISVHNKLNTPLYVDWKRSALVLHDESYTYWQNSSSIEASGHGHQIAWTPVVSSTSTSISGVIKTDESISFIAPNAYKQTMMVRVNPNFLELNEVKEGQKVRIETKAGTKSALRYDYTKDKSPLKFRSFLTISSEASFARASTYESEFWITEVVQAGVNPENFLDDQGDKNKFYNSRFTGFGSVVGLTVLVLLGVLLSGG